MSTDVVTEGGAASALRDHATRPATAPTPERATRRRLAVPWTSVHVLTLLVGAGALLYANRNQWFVSDEWHFIVNRGPGFTELDLFRPHNDHWSTIPLIIFWAILSTFGLSSYLPFAIPVVVFHLVLTHLLWRTCLRIGATPAIATAVAGAFAVLGAGSENLLWGFQMGFVGAVTFGFAAILLHDHDGPFDRRDAFGWVASVASLMCAGNAIVMVGIVGLGVWIRRRRLTDAVLVASVPVIVFASWYLLEGRHVQHVPQPPGAQFGVVDWTWYGLTYAVERVVGVPGTGGVLVLALIAWWVMHTDLARGRTAIACATGIGTFCFYLMTAFGRAGFGLEWATPGRYLYVAAALLVPTVALIVTRAASARVAPTAAIVGLTALVAFHNVALLRSLGIEQADREQVFKAYVLSQAEAIRAGEDPVWTPPNQWNPDLDTAGLREVLDLGYLP